MVTKIVKYVRYSFDEIQDLKYSFFFLLMFSFACAFAIADDVKMFIAFSASLFVCYLIHLKIEDFRDSVRREVLKDCYSKYRMIRKPKSEDFE